MPQLVGLPKPNPTKKHSHAAPSTTCVAQVHNSSYTTLVKSVNTSWTWENPLQTWAHSVPGWVRFKTLHKKNTSPNPICKGLDLASSVGQENVHHFKVST